MSLINKRRVFWLILVAWVLLLSAAVVYSSEKRDYEIWAKKNGEFVLMPHIAPLISVTQFSGEPLPEHGSLACEFVQETEKTPNGDTVKVLIGHCERGITVHLVGIDLNH